MATTPTGETTPQHRSSRALTSAEYGRLDQWDVGADIHTSSRVLAGFVAAARGRHPLDVRWGEACEDPNCVYRMTPMRVFDTRKEAFLAYITDQAASCGCKPQRLMDGVMVDLWGLTCSSPIIVGHLGGTWISKQVSLGTASLRLAPLCSIQCEVVRAIKDRLKTEALQLPAPGGERGVTFVVHPDAWSAIQLNPLGPLQDAVSRR